MESFKPLQDEVLKALVATTRSASHIAAADVEFQKSLNPSVGEQLDAQNARLLLLAQRLLENAAASSDAVGPKLPDVEAVDANWRGIVDVVDSLLEKADTSLDEYTGIVKRLSPAGEQTTTISRPNIVDKKHIAKPQLHFEHIPTNDEIGGFRPLLASKPHARIPLAECLKTFQDRRSREQYPHPYQSEIEQYDYPSSVYQQSEPQQYPPFESTTATFVDTFEAVETMLEELKKAKEIAIDLEHHDNRSYIGMVSLMQISTRDKDWIVDTLKPWRRKLECLNEVFADPGILKVLHGAYMDVIWLQRDLGLYLVGLFDTYHAARALGYPGASLAYLLSRFVQFKAQKQYQIADWRQRPLSKELFEYARADTHFLLYVYDNMRNELVTKSNFSDPEKNKVQDVLQKSKETALQRYEHPIYDTELGLGPVGWYKLISRTPVQFTPQQFSVFRAVHQWRDNLSRKEDESPLFIMPNHAVFSIARAMPADKAALFSAIQHVSHIIRAKADELVGVVTVAKKAGINGPELHDVLKTIDDMRDARHSAPQSPPEAPKAPQPAAVQLAPSSSAIHPPAGASRAPTSSFWGKLWNKSTGAQERSISTLSIDLALPLPPLTAELFTDSNGVNSDATPRAEKVVPTFVPKEERPPVDERSDLFVIKQLGGKKRKRNDTTEESTSSTPALDGTQDEVMLDEESEEAVRARAKAAKKALKKERKRQEAAQAEAARNDEPAFDYTTAPSVLHAQDAEGKKGKKDKKEKKGFTPFAGMRDAPKGLPRAQKEKAGKSKTFTS